MVVYAHTDDYYRFLFNYILHGNDSGLWSLTELTKNVNFSWFLARTAVLVQLYWIQYPFCYIQYISTYYFFKKMPFSEKIRSGIKLNELWHFNPSRNHFFPTILFLKNTDTEDKNLTLDHELWIVKITSYKTSCVIEKFPKILFHIYVFPVVPI